MNQNERIGLRIPAPLKARTQQLADRLGISLTELILRALRTLTEDDDVRWEVHTVTLLEGRIVSIDAPVQIPGLPTPTVSLPVAAPTAFWRLLHIEESPGRR